MRFAQRVYTTSALCHQRYHFTPKERELLRRTTREGYTPDDSESVGNKKILQIYESQILRYASSTNSLLALIFQTVAYKKERSVVRNGTRFLEFYCIVLEQVSL
jgi:hypothetical protein